MSELGIIYLLHFDSPLGDTTRPRMSAQHYVEWAKDGQLERRLNDHKKGKGAAITRWAVNHGIEWTVALLRDGTRDEERRLKNNGHHERKCPLCYS